MSDDFFDIVGTDAKRWVIAESGEPDWKRWSCRLCAQQWLFRAERVYPSVQHVREERAEPCLATPCGAWEFVHEMERAGEDGSLLEDGSRLEARGLYGIIV